jgi:hypothetical protein
MADPMLWLQRWNFIERARLERKLWEAFERRENLEALVEGCRREAEAEAGQPGGPALRFRLEVWQTTLERIRKIERMMQDKPRPDAR